MISKDVGARIRQRRKELKLTQQQIAHSVGCSRVSVTQWEIGDNYPGGANLLALAKVLGCSTDWIMYGATHSNDDVINTPQERTSEWNQTHGSPILGRIPLISWEEVSNYMLHQDDSNEEVKVIDYLPRIEITGPNAFYVTMQGDSMVAPPGGAVSLPEGTILLIDPSSTIDVGDCVAALVGGAMVVKKYVQDGNHHFLMPLNSSYTAVRVDESCTLVGPVLGVYNRLKRAGSRKS